MIFRRDSDLTTSIVHPWVRACVIKPFNFLINQLSHQSTFHQLTFSSINFLINQLIMFTFRSTFKSCLIKRDLTMNVDSVA